MKIALISFHFAEYAYHLACALADENNDILLILNKCNALMELPDLGRTKNDKNPCIIMLPHLKLRNPVMIINTFKIINAIYCFTPQVIHFQETGKDYLICAIPFLLKYPLVLTIHDHILHTGARENKRTRCYKKILRKIPDAVITHGDRIARETECLLPWLKGKVNSVEHGTLGKPEPTFDDKWEKGTLLFFGRIEEYKGLPYFIEAVKKLGNQDIRVKAIIAGRGNALNRYRYLIISDENFEVLEGYIPSDRIPDLFKRANVIVLPYTDATQSGIAAFALRYGRPVIATDTGSLPEIVRNGYNGLIVPPKNSLELYKAMEKLIKDQNLSKIMAKNSFLLSKTDYSWKSIAKKTLNIYRQVISDKSMNK